jgi:hypothetical protein
MSEYHDSRSHTRVLDVDPLTNKRRLFHWDAASQSFTIETVEDREDILEQNLIERNNINTSSWKGDIHKVASIPMVVLMELMTSGCTRDQQCMDRWLNDPANAPYRTRSGRV